MRHTSDFGAFIMVAVASVILTSSLLFPYLLIDANERSAKRFSPDGVFNYTSLLLSKEDNMLYVGARETLFALNITNISRTQLQRNVSIPSASVVSRYPRRLLVILFLIF